MRPTKSERMRYKELREIEPGLKELEAEIRAERPGPDGRYCANRVWYCKYKPRLCLLVGWEARLPGLRSMRDYDAAYQTLYDLLPDCNDCFCL